jgi:hypothetical protein
MSHRKKSARTVVVKETYESAALSLLRHPELRPAGVPETLQVAILFQPWIATAARPGPDSWPPRGASSRPGAGTVSNICSLMMVSGRFVDPFPRGPQPP